SQRGQSNRVASRSQVVATTATVLRVVLDMCSTGAWCKYPPTLLSVLSLVAFNPGRSNARPVSILSDADIRQYLAKGEIQIAPYYEAHLTPNGYDVTIEEILIPAASARTTTGVAKIPPTTRFAVSTRESVRLGRHVAGQIWLRTTWARRGVIASFGMIDAGFSGTLTFGAWNGSSDPL